MSATEKVILASFYGILKLKEDPYMLYSIQPNGNNRSLLRKNKYLRNNIKVTLLYLRNITYSM